MYASGMPLFPPNCGYDAFFSVPISPPFFLFPLCGRGVLQFSLPSPRSISSPSFPLFIPPSPGTTRRHQKEEEENLSKDEEGEEARPHSTAQSPPPHSSLPSARPLQVLPLSLFLSILEARFSFFVPSSELHFSQNQAVKWEKDVQFFYSARPAEANFLERLLEITHSP